MLDSTTPRTVLLTPEGPSTASRARNTLATLSIFVTLLGLATCWFWIFLEYTPLWWTLMIGSEDDNGTITEPVMGQSARDWQWTLSGAGIVLAAVAASASELLVGPRAWAWPYRRIGKLRSVEFTWVSVSIWLLVLGSIGSWLGQRLVPEIYEEVTGREDDRFALPWVMVLDGISFYAGKVSMIPISLLGVPLSRSSAMWRLAGLSYEEAITYHRWLGAAAVILTTVHTLGYCTYFLQHTRTGSGLPSLYKRLFSQEDGIRGLNPWCDGEYCMAVSNLAGLIAWAAGFLLALASFERVRRARYLRFIQIHQLHYLFFGFTAAHWSFGSFYMIPSAVFYAADSVLRWRGSYACTRATVRVHGSTDAALPSMVTLILPVPSPVRSSRGQRCPYRAPAQSTEACPHGLSSTATASQTTAGDEAEEDPWAGTTVYLTVRSLSPLRAMGGWTHPFTVAGSVALNAKDGTTCSRALLVNITPEGGWTKALAKRVAHKGTHVHLPGCNVTGPLPAPPHLMHVVRMAAAGHPLLLVGAGSGVTPCLALLRMLASRSLPPSARVRFLVIARSTHVLEALDGFMLPGTNGVTGVPWLSTELHLTRKIQGPKAVEDADGSRDTPSRGHESGANLLSAGSQPPSQAFPSVNSAAPPREWLSHAFRGGFRLSPVFDSCGGSLLSLKALPVPHTVLDKDGENGRLQHHARSAASASPALGRCFAADEMSTLVGALLGFLIVTWPLLALPTEDTAVWASQPTVISGLGSLLLAWLGALLGARLALALADTVRWAAWRRVSGEPTAAESDGQEVGSAAVTDPSQRENGATESTLNVHLASNGARPDMADSIKSFAAEGRREDGRGERQFLAAAGGPETLLDLLRSSLPVDVRLTRLTHPM